MKRSPDERLIKKHICDRWNVSVKLACVYVCFIRRSLHFSVSFFSFFFSTFVLSVLSFPHGLLFFLVLGKVWYFFQERFYGPLCLECSGPLIRTKSSAHEMTCMDCGRTQDYSCHVEALFRAHTLYNEGNHHKYRNKKVKLTKKMKRCLDQRRKRN